MRDPSPHLLAMQFLSEKLEAFVRMQTDPLRHRALLLADQTDDHEAFALAAVTGCERCFP